MEISMTYTYFVVVLLGALLLADYLFVYRYPSTELIEYVSAVTANSLDKTDPRPHRRQHHQHGHGSSDLALVPSPPPSSSISTGDDTTTKFKHDEAEATTTTTKPKHDFRALRFNAKLHMINQVQLFVDYPISYFITVKMNAANWFWVNANLISIIHPMVALLAGYCVIKAGQPDKDALSTANNNAAAAPPPPAATPARQATKNAAAGIEGVALMAQSTEMIPVIGNTTAARLSAASPSAVTPVSQQQQHLGDSMSERVNASGGLSKITIPGTPGVNNPTYASNGFDAPESPMVEGTELEESAGLQSAPLSAVNSRLLRIAAILFFTRNVLDTLDGVVARVQRHRRGEMNGSPSLGFNGHSLDMLTDTIGGFAIGIAVVMMLFSRSHLPIAKVPAFLLARYVSVPRKWCPRTQVATRCIAVFGLLDIGITGTFWESFMLRYANLFDTHANSNPAIFELDSNMHVRITQFLWAFSCGDALLGYLACALFFNRIWGFLQFLCFAGIPWVLLLSIYNAWVWHCVVLANPEAAAIVLRRPDLFM